MNSYAPCPKVVYPQYTADNISAHFIKHQDLPDRVTIFIQDRSGVGDKTTGPGLIDGAVFNRLWIMIQIQQLLN
jgi:hypothetical protein